MKRISANSNIEEVMASIGVGPEETLRESEKRQMMLRKFAQMRSRNPHTSLTLDETPTAFVQVDEELEEFVDITVTTKKFEQKGDDLPEKYHDYILQKAFTGHEVGHILYSDWPALEHYKEEVMSQAEDAGLSSSDAKSRGEMFMNFANVLEDGAIEKYLGEDFRLNEEIVHLRKTIHEDKYFGQSHEVDSGETKYFYPFFFAVMVGCLNLGVYDNGELDKLLDENNETHKFAVRGGEKDKEMLVNNVIPMLRSKIPEIHQKTDAWERMEEIHELWVEISKYINKSQTPGRVEFEHQQKKRDSNSYCDGVPENLSDAHGDQESIPVSIDSGEDDSKNNNEDDELTHGEKQGIESETSHDSEGGVEEKAKRGIRDETKQKSGDWSDEIEKIIDALEGGEGVDEIAIAEDGSVNQGRLEEAQNLSKRTSRLFARRLRQLNKDKVVRNKERGEFDSRALISAERGSTRTFRQVKKGDEKNYSCMIVVDRSGSMSSNIDDVELAVGAISWGLEDNGVDTCILDTESSMTTLSKPFGTSTDSFKEKIFAGRCGGGTPLTHTMNFARTRMERGEGDFPFCIVITDGRPANTSSFKEEVAKANFPVLGLYMPNNRKNVQSQLSLYDKAVTCTNDDDVGAKIMNMINSIIF